MSAALALTWRQYRLERKMFWRNPSAAFFNFVLPLLFLALFGAIFAGSQEDLDVIVPGIAGMSIMTTTFVALAMNLVFLREQGVLKRLRGTPLPSGAYLAGARRARGDEHRDPAGDRHRRGRAAVRRRPARTTGSCSRSFVAAGVVCLAALGVALSHAIPNFDSAPAYVNAIFLPVIVISGVFYDADNAPAFLRDIAQALPLTHLIDGLSAAMVTRRAVRRPPRRPRRGAHLGGARASCSRCAASAGRRGAAERARRCDVAPVFCNVVAAA